MIDGRRDVIAEHVREDLHDHLADFKQYGAAYISEYIDCVLAGKQTRPHGHVHPKLAEFVRELVLDAAAMDRRGV